MSVAALIEKKLEAALEPVRLEIVDESHLHAGHANAPEGGESHFHVTVAAAPQLRQQGRGHRVFERRGVSRGIAALGARPHVAGEARPERGVG